MGSGARNEEESQLKGGIGMVSDERNQAISIATPCDYAAEMGKRRELASRIGIIVDMAEDISLAW